RRGLPALHPRRRRGGEVGRRWCRRQRLLPRRARPPAGFEAGRRWKNVSTEEHVFPPQAAVGDGYPPARVRPDPIVGSPTEMPIYGYRCRSCGHEFEVLQKMSDASLKSCPKCSGQLSKIVYPAGIVYKGSGYYSTDYKSGGKAASAASG